MMQKQKRKKETKKSIELVGRARSHGDACFTKLTHYMVDGGCAQSSLSKPSKSIMKSKRSDADKDYAKVDIPRTSKCNSKNDRNTRMTKVSVKTKGFLFKKQCYRRYLRNKRNERRLFGD